MRHLTVIASMLVLAARWQHPDMPVSFEVPPDWSVHHRVDMAALVYNQRVRGPLEPFLRLDWRSELRDAATVEQDIRDELAGHGDVVEEVVHDRITISGWATDRLRIRARIEGVPYGLQVLLVRVRAPAGYLIVTALPASHERALGPALQHAIGSMRLGDHSKK